MSATELLARRTTLAREERAAPGLELREGEDGSISFSGVASTVEQSYTVTDMFGEYEETMAEGAFDQTIKRGDVRLLVNHEGVPLARTKSRTLFLKADPHLRADAPNLDASNPTVQEVRSAMKRGDIDQMSIAFRVLRQEWDADYTKRRVLEVRLFDVSVVTYPANPHTSAMLRSVLRSDLDGPEKLRAAIAELQAMLPLEPEIEQFEQQFDARALERMRHHWRRRSPEY